MKKITRWWVARTSPNDVALDLATVCTRVINRSRVGNAVASQLTQVTETEIERVKKLNVNATDINMLVQILCGLGVQLDCSAANIPDIIKREWDLEEEQ
ncbi:hypothetical protein PR1_106 [Providencia phage vB_PreS_PR1]|uniref:Uncharacterized protein n=1 Tax=Providencia phage vB_PreS_PR1 TaxID=1931407 RepID=A0A1S6KV52_9CAUD|nr:hypothetical protein FDH30_gp108 [Providencia phage vB_PreS_PR1]AQT25318.1 hypothetical protein PR1_106 [Providencia phage vB_PreS_PR1]